MFFADGFRNNQFEGMEVQNGQFKSVLGDYRIPPVAGLDIGAGEFILGQYEDMEADYISLDRS